MFAEGANSRVQPMEAAPLRSDPQQQSPICAPWCVQEPPPYESRRPYRAHKTITHASQALLDMQPHEVNPDRSARPLSHVLRGKCDEGEGQHEAGDGQGTLDADVAQAMGRGIEQAVVECNEA